MKTCKVKNCHNKHYAKNFCRRHYDQYRTNGKVYNRFRTDPNEIIVIGKIAKIKLYNKNNTIIGESIIDKEDIGKASEYRWCLANGYCKSSGYGLHRAILSLHKKDPRIVDHINHDTLDNRKINLRICTNTENIRNSGMSKNNTSGYKGVSYRKKEKNWRAYIRVNSVQKYLGCFKTKEQAAEMYNEAAKWYHGEFACLNKLEGSTGNGETK
jgi:hypothetical protein